jgi:hypothetical protein
MNGAMLDIPSTMLDIPDEVLDRIDAFPVIIDAMHDSIDDVLDIPAAFLARIAAVLARTSTVLRGREEGLEPPSSVLDGKGAIPRRRAPMQGSEGADGSGVADRRSIEGRAPSRA